MKIFLLVVVCLAVTVGISTAKSHLRCNGKELELPGIDDYQSKCSDKGSKACKLYCVIQQLGVFNAENKLDASKAIEWVNSLPQDIQGEFKGALEKWVQFGAGVGSIKLDAKCSQIEPFVKVAVFVVSKRCEILDHAFIL